MFNKKYYNIYILFFSILFLSTFVFSYDEEKIVVLCLISFVTILYYNFHQVIFDSLNEQSIALKEELVNLFKEKIIIMRKLRYTWRIFLDIEDYIIDMYCWVKQTFVNIIQNKNLRRINTFSRLVIRKDLNNLFQAKLLIKENLKRILLNLLKQKMSAVTTVKQLTLNELQSFNSGLTQKHFLLNKLKINSLNKTHYNHYNSFYYLKFFFN